MDELDHTVLYDGDCGFCKCLLALVLTAHRGHRLRPAAIQSAAGQALLADLPGEQQLASWHIVAPDGSRHSGGVAIPVLLSLLPAGRLTAPVAARFPGTLDRGYRWVAANRVALSRPIPKRLKRRASGAVARAETDAHAGARPPRPVYSVPE